MSSCSANWTFWSLTKFPVDTGRRIVMRGVKALRKVLVPKSIPFFTPFFRLVHKDSTPLLSLFFAWLLTLEFVLFKPFLKMVTPSLKPFLIILFNEESLFMKTTLSLFRIGHCCVSFFHIAVLVGPVKAGDRVPWYGPIVGSDPLVVQPDSLKLSWIFNSKPLGSVNAGDGVPWYGPIVGCTLVVQTDSLKLSWILNSKPLGSTNAGDGVPL